VHRLALLAALILFLPTLAGAEFVAQEDSFKCLLEGKKVEGKTFFVFHRNKRKLRRALRIAERDLPGKHYPVGTILQLFPFEAMAKRGGHYNPEGGGWEFFQLSVSSQGTTIVRRGGAEVTNRFAGSCQNCHAAASTYDFVCEGHNVAALPLSDDLIRALQYDPRCTP
jgi:hypothetical protein